MKIGIIGLGTVGEGVLKVLTLEKNNIFEKSNSKIEVKYACDINIDRDFSFDFDKSILITDYKKILEDIEVDIVVELIGGETIAKKIILEALQNKKNVVTANKALIAKHGIELFKVAKENNVAILFEAAVGGGIPIITPLTESLIANTITEIFGIMNGTSNYILTKMKKDNLSFEEALDLAKEKGYAEEDPTYDIMGIDAGHKINILASLAYGGAIKFDEMSLDGIVDVTPIDIKIANKMNYSIKLIAHSKLYEDGDVEISVEPCFVSNELMLSKVDDVYNAIETIGSYTGETFFYGKGAGMDPTASAVVADIVKISTNSVINSDYFFNSDKKFNLIDNDKIKGDFYIRASEEVECDCDFYEKVDIYNIYIAHDKTKEELKKTFESTDYTIFKIIN